MQLAFTLTLLAATSSAIQMSKSVDCVITYEHNNCGKFDDYEDCRENAYLGLMTRDEYEECVMMIDYNFWEECGGDYAIDWACYDPHGARY